MPLILLLRHDEKLLFQNCLRHPSGNASLWCHTLRGMALWPFPLGPQPSRSWAHRSVLPLWHRVNKVTFLRLSAALPRFAHARLAVETVGWFHSALRFSRFHAANTAKRFFDSLQKRRHLAAILFAAF